MPPCLDGHFSFPTQPSALALSVLRSGHLALEQWAGIVLRDWLQAIRQILMTLNITGWELEPDPFSPGGTLCPLFIS